MNTEPSGSLAGPAASGSAGPWSHRRLGTLVVLVFAAHLGFIFALGDRPSSPSRPTAPTTVLNLLPVENELLALNDPTLFALPNAHGVAGQTWLKTPVVSFVPYRWPDEPRLLALRLEELGAAFGRFMQTNTFTSLVFDPQPEPEGFQLATPEPAAERVTHSTFRLAGNLANRRWLNPPALPSWTNTDLLTKTVVQALVLDEGGVRSVTQLATSSEAAADQYALQLARQARFNPVRTTSGMTLGQLVFHWHTEPKPPAGQMPP